MYQLQRDAEQYSATATPAAAAAPNETTAKALENATLNPRFYTTDFDEMNRISVETVREQWDELIAEFRRDPNKDHFKRTAEFEADFSQLDPRLRREFIEFLTSSVTAEFSGCILYAEIKKRCRNQDVRDLFGVMSRDEGRHAGFINHVLNDFNVQVDLGFLTRAKKYTFFKPKYIYYATYLSEKIGYARYITIFRHFEQHPDKRFHPIFKWFENWCHDEFRHGEAFALLMRANPSVTAGLNRYWIRFFLLAVFSTMYVRDHLRRDFFGYMGIDVDDYDRRVIRLTSTISKQVFPLEIDLDNPAIWARFEKMYQLNKAMAEGKGGVLAKLKVAANFIGLFLTPVKDNAVPADVRMQPVW
ncbi:MAG: magnesium-protoporphyrin IX monomethyl ester (oxidative) cyclase [Gemmatimonadaceae bacterium]|jgi:magnesium-protoporphyrin IX monomethyl ester (oxidative) cyclase|nr:magnesium-protoporphyrin IX monomethyl ester (oxidative) cyclase [Gemmatimonadaceae bacterium]